MKSDKYIITLPNQRKAVKTSITLLLNTNLCSFYCILCLDDDDYFKDHIYQLLPLRF